MSIKRLQRMKKKDARRKLAMAMLELVKENATTETAGEILEFQTWVVRKNESRKGELLNAKTGKAYKFGVMLLIEASTLTGILADDRGDPRYTTRLKTTRSTFNALLKRMHGTGSDTDMIRCAVEGLGGIVGDMAKHILELKTKKGVR